jgi:hypothetical protein
MTILGACARAPVAIIAATAAIKNVGFMARSPFRRL